MKSIIYKFTPSSESESEYPPTNDNRYKELRFYYEALILNHVIEEMRKDPEMHDVCNIEAIYDAGLIYNIEYLDPPLKMREFNDLWYETECRVQYLNGNGLAPCFCSEHRKSEITKLYNFKAQHKIVQDFVSHKKIDITTLSSLCF